MLQKQQYMHGLKHDVIIGHFVLPVILNVFYNSKGHQEPLVHLKQYEDFLGGLNYAKSS